MNLFDMATSGIEPRAPAPPPPAPAPAQSEAAPVAVPERLASAFDAAARAFDVDPAILRGIAFAESRFRPDIIDGTVRSPKGAAGLMQFMPDTAKRYGIDPLNAEESIFGAAQYLRESLDRFGGDYQRAVASYNWGPNRKAFDREDWHKSLPAETTDYVGRVLGYAADQPASARVDLPAGVEPNEGAGAGRGDAGAELRARLQHQQDVDASRPVGVLGRPIQREAAQPAAPAPASGLAQELGSLRDTFFTGVDQAIAGGKTLNTVAQVKQLQRVQDQLAELESSGRGDSPQAQGLRTTIAHYERRMPQMAAGAAEAQAAAQRGSRMTTRPAVQKLNEAKTFGEAWDAFKEAPYDVIAGVTAQSLPSMLPALVVGVLTGPVGGAAAMGASSGLTEAGASLGDFAADRGVDVTDPKALQAFFADRQNMADALQYAGTRAGVIAAADTASAGLAGRTLAPAMRSQAARQIVNMPVQMAAQAASGAGGEAGAQLATKGEIDQPGAVLAEAVGELGGAPAEVASFSKDLRAALRQPAVAPAPMAAPRVEDQPTVPVAPVVPPGGPAIAPAEPAVPAPVAAPAATEQAPTSPTPGIAPAPAPSSEPVAPSPDIAALTDRIRALEASRAPQAEQAPAEDGPPPAAAVSDVGVQPEPVSAAAPDAVADPGPAQVQDVPRVDAEQQARRVEALDALRRCLS